MIKSKTKKQTSMKLSLTYASELDIDVLEMLALSVNDILNN